MLWSFKCTTTSKTRVLWLTFIYPCCSCFERLRITNYSFSARAGQIVSLPNKNLSHDVQYMSTSSVHKYGFEVFLKVKALKNEILISYKNILKQESMNQRRAAMSMTGEDWQILLLANSVATRFSSWQGLSHREATISRRLLNWNKHNFLTEPWELHSVKTLHYTNISLSDSHII